MSPYLFVLVAEGLSALINIVVSKGDIHGIQIFRGTPKVSHLLFTGDYFLFYRATLTEVTNLMGLLRSYAEASGQEINMTKSEVFFSHNICRPAREDMACIMGVHQVLGTSMYLRLPSIIGRSKKANFAFIKDHLLKKINSWRGRSLSKAGKEVMTKLVLQAIPSYIMSDSVILDDIMKDIKKMLNCFWWGGINTNKGVMWLAWEKLMYSKKEGGLGFRDFNMDMVTKQGFHMMTKPKMLVSKVFKARYYPRSSFLEVSLGNNPSFVWRTLWRSRKFLTLGCRWSIGDVSRIKVMSEPWLRGMNKVAWEVLKGKCVYDINVDNVRLTNVKQWDVQEIRDVFTHDVANDILKVPLLEDVLEDSMVWKEEQNEVYRVKSSYWLLRSFQTNRLICREEGDWGSLWNIKAPPRAKHLLWRIFRGCLPTRKKLRQHFVQCTPNCQLCENSEEDECHVFFGCGTTNQSWRETGLYSNIEPCLNNFSDVNALILDICSIKDMRNAGRVAVLIWMIWNNRNNAIWNNDREEASKLGMQAYHT
ncbi:hypothetical protein KIW84_065444 [Lathyrus oleraceus]|uniref:Reverse transcriptase zinc-binding domain-containing protein n=1 Tax=Pisum sativum TaxID=3888 RepID=A0A9D4WED0_PEA|nr:hypothetical protein KIW84_065444 [Pisum sativum]